LRVAHLIHGLGLGGAQQVIKFIVAGRGAGFEHVVISCHGGVCLPQIEAAGAKVLIVPRRLPKLDPLWTLAMARAFRREEVDVVHGHLFGDSLHGYFACRLSGRLPMVMTLHNSTDARSALQLRGYRWLLGARTLPIACAEFVRHSFLAQAGAPAQGIRTIANGIPDRVAGVDAADLRRRLLREHSFPDDALVLATLGRLTAQKAYDHLLRALARVDAALPWRLLLFGDGEQRLQLEALAVELGLQERVRCVGFRADAADCLAACDAVVFSSLFEGLPIALLEAMAMARPVVATRVGGIPDAVDDGIEALLVPPRDEAALAGAIERLLRDSAARESLGTAGRARFVRQFRAQAMVERYEAVYREAAAGRAA
jgi:glycosyltransferase involved in cell wall biosynthesis